MIVRAGGSEAAAAYLDKAQARHGTRVMGHWHTFRVIDPAQAQSRIVYLAGNRGGVGTEEDDDHLHGLDAEWGIGGEVWVHSTSMINVARYVAVAPRNASTSVRNLPFRAG
jgi:hypothetical protein